MEAVNTKVGPCAAQLCAHARNNRGAQEDIGASRERLRGVYTTSLLTKPSLRVLTTLAPAIYLLWHLTLGLTARLLLIARPAIAAATTTAPTATSPVTGATSAATTVAVALATVPVVLVPVVLAPLTAVPLGRVATLTAAAAAAMAPVELGAPPLEADGLQANGHTYRR
jgi:hypothetical protein